MWRWKHFDSLDGLLQFVNELGLTGDQFKVVNSPAPRRAAPYGAPMYLIYIDPQPAPDETLLSATEEVELVEAHQSAIDAAEEILHGHVEQPPSTRDPRQRGEK